MREVNQAGLDLIKGFEGLSLKPYLDSVGIATIGYGNTTYPDGTPVTINDASITNEQALEYFQADLDKKTAGLTSLINIQINDNEFAALASFAYNLGLGALGGSTLLKLLNSNADRAAVADQFLRWNHAGGKELAGLTHRRQAERSLFLQPVVQSDMLPDGPSQDEINAKLKQIEDDIMK